MIWSLNGYGQVSKLSIGIGALVSFALSSWLGSEVLSPYEFWNTLNSTDSVMRTMILDWRLPRVITAFFVGACLGIAGVIFQGIFRNPLAEPHLLGTASGASVGAAIALLLPTLLPGPFLLPILAFSGAWFTTVIVISIARIASVESSYGLILAGVAIAALLTSIRGLLMLSFSDDAVSLQVVISWTLGAIQTPTWYELGFFVVFATSCFLFSLKLTRGLDILGLGTDTAKSMGMNVTQFIHRSVLLAAAVTALSVVWGGLIGFVGLVIPHIIRWWLGPRHHELMIYSALLSGAVVMLLDGFARSILPPAEIPIGLLTALLGAPFFLFILIREARR